MTGARRMQAPAPPPPPPVSVSAFTAEKLDADAAGLQINLQPPAADAHPGGLRDLRARPRKADTGPADRPPERLSLPFPEFDPVLVHLGPLAIRWYALAYVAGILIGWRYGVALVRNTKIWRGAPAHGQRPADRRLRAVGHRRHHRRRAARLRALLHAAAAAGRPDPQALDHLRHLGRRHELPRRADRRDPGHCRLRLRQQDRHHPPGRPDRALRARGFVLRGVSRTL